jgi:arylsulfatase A-like enzyme
MTTTRSPNILIIWGDDIGTSNLSIFTKGMMGYRTPNIDRIAEQGILFTDRRAQGRSTSTSPMTAT